MGGITILLYGYIASSGLRMFKDVDFNDIRNTMIISIILIIGIGGLTLSIGSITLTSVACALILGIISNLILFK
jgi:uracil permease